MQWYQFLRNHPPPSPSQIYSTKFDINFYRCMARLLLVGGIDCALLYDAFESCAMIIALFSRRPPEEQTVRSPLG